MKLLEVSSATVPKSVESASFSKIDLNVTNKLSMSLCGFSWESDLAFKLIKFVSHRLRWRPPKQVLGLAHFSS